MNKHLHLSSLCSLLLLSGLTASAQSNYATGTLPTGMEFTSGPAGIYAVADFNGDGAVDILYSTAAGGALTYLQNNGSGSFSTPATGNPFVNFLSSTPTGFALSANSSVADFDGDGDLDIWFRNAGAGNDIYLRNNAGVYVSDALPPGLEFTASTGVAAVTVADFNGDGYVDIAYTTAAAGAINYLQNNGSGSFSTPATGNPFANFTASSPAGFALTASSSTADFDADGDLDIWMRIAGASNDIYLQKNGSTYVQIATMPGMDFTATGVGGVSVGDFNGDGYPDYLYNTGIGTPLVYVQNMGGSFTVPASNPFGDYTTTGIADLAFSTAATVSDFDADGDLDIWMRVTGSGNDVYLTNSGAAPEVLTTTPAHNALGVDRNANIVLTFSEVMYKGTGNIYIRKLSDNSIVETIPVTGALVSGDATNTITINPVTILAANTAYYITFDRRALIDNETIIMGHLDLATRTRQPETSPSFLTFTTGSTILAIKLIGITATATDKGTCNISWTAVGDNTADKMELERSTDGQHFSAIYTTAARIGTQQYSYADEGVSGKVFYRVRMVTADGSSAYSEVVSVTLRSGLQFDVYPNPVTDKFIVTSSVAGTALLYDLNGRLMYSSKISSGSTTVDTRNLPSGSYFLQLNTGNEHHTRTVIKQ